MLAVVDTSVNKPLIDACEGIEDQLQGDLLSLKHLIHFELQKDNFQHQNSCICGRAQISTTHEEL